MPDVKAPMKAKAKAPRLRLLPLLAAVAILMLGARAFEVWQGSAVLAQDRPQDLPAAADAEAGEATAEAAPQEAAAEAPDSPEAPRDPLSMTDSEVELLQALAERRAALARRERAIEEREALLQAAERRIEEKVRELTSLQTRIESLLKQHEEQTEAQYRSLVKIYSNMKPKDAARIFEELDMDVLLPVVERMKERKAAPILAKMNAEKAKSITTELAQRRLLSEKR